MKLLTLPLVLLAVQAFAQPQPPLPADGSPDTWRGSAPKINDLVHTRLDVRPDYKKCYLYGEERLTLHPHFYPTDTLTLDAKGMDIRAITIVKANRELPLHYRYNGQTITIHLDKTYKKEDHYTIHLAYTAKPNQLKLADTTLLKYNKGLYFVNPDSSEKNTPVQVYTQGETENASVWFPTIDKPDQKTTSELHITIPAKYITLSNGRLAAQHDNHDGTRTDTWKMDLPNPPYLFMLAVGDFRIYHDHWRDKPVDYYLEPEYAPYAKAIFGATPEAIDFFSKTLHYDFPWNKYAQIVVRDYASGGMENTTATLLNDYVQRTPRELLDVYYGKGEKTIVHELFHQWFGCLVTCRNWGNQAVDETFSEFGDGLWAGHKYGKDEEDALRDHDWQTYLKDPNAATRTIVRHHYANELDMFDVVTYYKGSNVLNMLRTYLGDSAFYEGLSRYLHQQAFGNGDVQQLRLALEEVSGLDLTWFFDQWYYRPGHPVLDIRYDWNPSTGAETVYVRQTQQGPPYALPVAVDIYNQGRVERHNAWLTTSADTLSFQTATQPDLINVDAQRVLVAKIDDHKTMRELLFQYTHAPLYLDRKQAIDAAIARPDDPLAEEILLKALQDKYYGLRIAVLQAISKANPDLKAAAMPTIVLQAQNDSNTLARAAAIEVLAREKNKSYLPLFDKALQHPSYAVEAAALLAIDQIDHNAALEKARQLQRDSKGPLATAIKAVYVNEN
ncbi:MAG TPA: M1 family aminopeptidase [Puia sp.]|nr:M1 family aminopeptidase [Puia sp.]